MPLVPGAIAAAFGAPWRADHLLIGPGRAWWIATAPWAFFTPLRLRTMTSRVAGHRFPPAKDCDRLLRLAADEIATSEPVERVGLAGLALLLIHPFVDGNGRSARFVWLKGLIDLEITPRDAVAALDAFYGLGGIGALPTFHAAANGSVAPFLTRWTTNVEFVRVGSFGRSPH